MKQQSFASLTYAAKKRKTRKERFLEQMESCVPWSAFEAIIEPYYPKAGKRGGQPIGLSVMLRIYLMQQWFNLSDPMMEDALYEIESMRRFAGLELCEDRLPDETTILKFRHLLEVTTHPYQHRAVPKRPFEWRPADCIPDLPWSAGNWICGNRP
ncbi:transposase, partial [Thiolapillus sp.]|uniref:transposase n=3 Tax=Thiolapillus sp. TaxID=2017437 RepID=UPI0025E3E646